MKKHLFLVTVALLFVGFSALAQDHHWPLKENLNDIVGGKNGTNHGVTFQNDAVRGPVAYFNGDSYANLPGFLNGLTEVTIAAWFRMDESRVWSRIYSFGHGDQTEPKDVLMTIPVSGNNNMYRFTLSVPGEAWYDLDFPKEIIDIQLNTWYFACAVLKPDSIILYHNNEQVLAEGGFPRPFGEITDTENALGKSFWPDPLWKGALSDLRVFKSALTEAQVKELYKKTAATGIDQADHHWPLKENLDDLAGGKNGTNHGVTFQNDAVRGPVAYFDGNSYANLPGFLNGLTEITISTWFRMDESRVWSRIYSFGHGDQTEPKDVLMTIPVSGNNNMYRFTLSVPGGAWYDLDFPKEIIDIQLNTWYFACAVLKPDSIILYHNNEQVLAEGGFPRPFGEITDTENALGKSFWPDQYWKGALSDMRIYKSALTETQVKELYNKTVATGINQIDVTRSKPLVYTYDGRLVVKLESKKYDELVSVYTETGALITRKPVHEINSVDLRSGLYIIKVTGSEVNYSTKVFVTR